MTPIEVDRVRILDRDRQRRKRERDRIRLREARGKITDDEEDISESIKVMESLIKKRRNPSNRRKRCDMTPEQLQKLRFQDKQRQRKKRSEMTPEQLAGRSNIRRRRKK